MNDLKENQNISFIIPAFNCAEFISETIESIFNGNFSDGDEIIIVDDASTDNTFEVIFELQKKYKSISIFQHKFNKGSAAAGRNTGIENSKNDLIFCLDADNILTPYSIPKLKEFLLLKNADAAAFGEIHYFENSVNNVTLKWILNGNITFIDNINKLQKTPCSSGNYLFTKKSWKLAGRYNENVGGAYDSWAYGCCQLATGARMITLKNTYYYHRRGYESTYIKQVLKRNTSLNILQIILPYIHLIDDRDVNYIFSKKARFNWFINIDEKPIKINKNSNQEQYLKYNIPQINYFKKEKKLLIELYDKIYWKTRIVLCKLFGLKL